jgi:hypothetical protein
MPYRQGGYWYDDEGRMLVRALAGGAPLPAGSYEQGGSNFTSDGKLIVYDETLDLVGSSRQVAMATGVAANDTLLIQNALDAGAGTVSLAPFGDTYVVNGVTVPDNVRLNLAGATIKLADAANTYAVSTAGYASLTGTDSTAGSRDFAIINGYIDGNKANNTDTTKPTLAIYGRRYTLENVVVRNGKGTGIRSEWATTSPFQAPNGFESYVDKVYTHSCDGHGLDFNGPHDTFFGSIFAVKCATIAGTVPLNFADTTGRSNGCNVQQAHIYGGGGYAYGLVAGTSGMRFVNIISEGAQTAQVQVVASQVQIDGAHLYSGGIATATVKGLQIGDATHTGINGCLIRAKVENCGGGVADVTNMGDHNVLDLHCYHFSGTTPTKTDLGFTGTPPTKNTISLVCIDNTFTPTAATSRFTQGAARVVKAVSGDTRDMLALQDEAGGNLYRIDHKGRPRVAGATPGIAIGSNIGTAPNGAAVSITGSDHAGKIAITTATTGVAAGQLAAITFAQTFATDARVVLTAKDAASAALQSFTTSAASAFSVRTGQTPAISTTYTFDYIVIGV